MVPVCLYALQMVFTWTALSAHTACNSLLMKLVRELGSFISQCTQMWCYSATDVSDYAKYGEGNQLYTPYSRLITWCSRVPGNITEHTVCGGKLVAV